MSCVMFHERNIDNTRANISSDRYTEIRRIEYLMFYVKDYWLCGGYV